MTVLVDIRCPNCGTAGAVEKVGLGQYQCGDCGTKFTQDDLEPASR